MLLDTINTSNIRSEALKMTSAASPSGLDTASWRRICTSFKSTSNDLCHSLAITAQRLCTNFVDPSAIAPLLAGHLIALDKNPGVHPIRIGDSARCMFGKAILTITRTDNQEAAGSLQLCAGQISSIEAAVPAVNALFQQEEPRPFCW